MKRQNKQIAAIISTASLIILILALPHLTPLDLTLLNRIHSQASPTFTLLAKSFSLIGAPRTLWPGTLAIAAFLWFRHHPRPALTLLATMIYSGLLETLIKLAVRRPRPAVTWAYVQENTFSFPSGHATLAVALYGLLSAYALHRPPAQRTLLLILSLAMTLSIGLSRLYLGAHHPSDVLAGYLTGATCLITFRIFNKDQNLPHQNLPPG